MKNGNGKVIARITVMFLLLQAALPALAQDYELSWSTIGGGGMSTGGSYTIMGTIAQPDAGVMSGGDYELLGGFWPGGPLCFVNFEHFARFAEHWLDEPCNEGNNWCDGADLNQLGDVDLIDFGLFVEEWLYYCPLDWQLK